MVGIKTKRPKAISAISITGWIIVTLSFLIAFSPAVKKIGEAYPSVCSFIACLQFISLVGIWYMKRWGVNLFVLAFFAQNIIYVFMGYFDKNASINASLVFSGFYVVYIFILLPYYKIMDVNL